MNAQTTHYYGDVLVIFEGRRRINWHRRSRAEWVPVSVWPSTQQTQRVQRHIAVGEPVLIVVEEPEASVVVLSEQLAAAPPALAAFASELEGDVADFRIPAFDWLPGPLRERGLEFLRSNVRRAQEHPESLSPPAILEPVPLGPLNLRFLHVVRRCPQIDRELPHIVDAAFGEPLRATA
jgi:hypothetical protein